MCCFVYFVGFLVFVLLLGSRSSFVRVVLYGAFVRNSLIGVLFRRCLGVCLYRIFESEVTRAQLRAPLGKQVFRVGQLFLSLCDESDSLVPIVLRTTRCDQKLTISKLATSLRRTTLAAHLARVQHLERSLGNESGLAHKYH